MTSITLPYPPSANTYWRVWQGRPVKSDEARAYQALVALKCRSEAMRPLVGQVSVTVSVYRPAKRGDLDNSLKVLLDALKGFAYLDDKQVTRIVAEQHDDKARPRVEVEILERAVAP
jgi:crossover junction endodeoxyribonuclease RusA